MTSASANIAAPAPLKLAHGSATVAKLLQQFQGRELFLQGTAGDRYGVRLETIQARHAQLHLRIRAAGFEFEVLFVDTRALVDLGAALAPGVPMSLQRAAVMHAMRDLWRTLENATGTTLELIGLSDGSPTWSTAEALAFKVTRGPKPTDAQSPASRAATTAVMIKAVDEGSWACLRAALARSLLPLGQSTDALVETRLLLDSVDIELAELACLEIGDVIALDRPASDVQTPRAELRSEDGRRLAEMRLDSSKGWHVNTLFSKDADAAEGGNSRDKHNSTMNFKPLAQEPDQAEMVDQPSGNDEAHESVAADGFQAVIDEVPLRIDLELGSITLKVSELRGMQVGHIFEADASSMDAMLTMKTAGRVLGRARLIALGDRLGVQVVELRAPEVLPSED